MAADTKMLNDPKRLLGPGFAVNMRSFAKDNHGLMYREKIKYQNVKKWLAGLIYLSFFLVQFNIHPGNCPRNISYFSSDYSSVNNNHPAESVSHLIIHRDSKHTGFKFNKRFHPEKLLTAPSIPQAPVDFCYHTVEPLIHEDQPLTEFSFNAPSHRGPPSIV